MIHRSVKINTPQIVHEAFDDEVVIVNLDSGNYYSLEGVGADVWQFIQNGAHTGVIATSIAERYAGDRSDIESAIERLLSDLEAEEIVTLSEGTLENLSEDNDAEIRAAFEKAAFNAPVLNRFTDMQELLLLDPVHDVDETGWPRPKETGAVAEL